MFISKLILHKCKRFYLKGIETLEINPDTKTQIILGTNGSGKSSLLNIGFSVLPGEKNDFHTGGYKSAEVLHKGNTYILRTDVTGKSPTHSFICNDEELNEGKTGAVQRELVREHFNMTTELHKVLTGQTVFTKMSAVQRREWITLLSSAEFDYVMGLYAKIKRGVRDKGVLIKHLSERLVTETTKKVSDEVMETLRKQSQEITERLLGLHQHSKRDGLADNFEVYEREYHQIHADVEGLLERARHLKVATPDAVDSTDIDDVIEVRDSLRSRVQMLSAALQEVSDRHQDVDKQLHDVNELEKVNPEELTAMLVEMESNVAKLESTYRCRDHIDQLPLTTHCMNTVNEVIAALHEVNVSDDKFLDRATIQSKQGKLADLQNKLMAGTSRISELEYRLNHIHNCSTITCPSCNHGFKEGVSKDEEAEIKTLLNKGYSFRTNMKAKVDEVVEWIETSRSVGDSLYTLNQIKDRNPDLVALWTMLSKAGGFSQGRELTTICKDFIHDVNVRIKIDKLHAEMKPIHERLQAIRQLDGSSGLRDMAHSLSERIVALKTSLVDAKETLKIVEQFHSRLVSAYEVSLSVDVVRKRMDDLMTQMVRFVANEEITAKIREHQIKLAKLDQTYSEAQMQMGIIKDLNQSLEQTAKEERALVALEKALSPKDGIIAEQIMVFINTFISRINDVIAKVWGYNMALDTCDLTEGDLDYKFPMYIHTIDNMVPDIEFGSDSQVDIINQAFRLVVYEFMGLEGYPLYLDELGRTFDEVHRLNLTLALKDLLDDERYSQVFIISHSFEGQNSFPNSQIAVIDDSHVQLNRSFNEHVTIS